MYLYLFSVWEICSVLVTFWVLQEVWLLSSASCFPTQNLFHHTTHGGCLIIVNRLTIFLSVADWNWVLSVFFIFTFFYAKSVTLICSVVYKEKGSRELKWIWNSEEMGDSNWSKRHGDFMCKRSLCFVSGHLQSRDFMCKRGLCFVSGHLQSNCHLFFVSSYYGLDFLLSGFERAEEINSQMKGQKKKKKKTI